MDEELHIAGIVVLATRAGLQRVGDAIAAMPGAEIHAVSPEGKLVITLEALSSREIISHLETVQHLDGVLSAALVYQHSESLEFMNEEVSDEGLAPGIH